MAFTYTEAVRRLRLLSKMAKQIDREIPANAKAEIGTRTTTLFFDQPPATPGDAFAADDDLCDWLDFDTAYRFGFAKPGEVVHIYFSEPLTRWGGGDLINTVMGWMGTDTEPPVLIDVPGFKINRGAN